MGFRCVFFPCKWLHVCNPAVLFDQKPAKVIGLFQCTRCKTLSVGSPR